MSPYIAPYFERIGYAGKLKPTAAALRALHRQHLFTVPFENLDIPLGTPIRVEIPLLYEKIILRQRGGFCYELNGLFAWLLSQLGFQVHLLSGRVRSESGGFGPEFDHMALKVELDGPWLVDVGFGDSFLSPIPLVAGGTDYVNGRRYFLSPENGDWVLIRKDEHGELPQYRFSEVPHELSDYAAMCEYHQTSPRSHFTRSWTCSKATPDGRITLANKRLIVTRDGKRQETLLASEVEIRSALREYFGVELPEADLSRLL